MLDVLDGVTEIPQYTEKNLLNAYTTEFCDNRNFTRIEHNYIAQIGIKHSFTTDTAVK